MGKIVSSVDVNLGVGFGELDLALGRGHAQFCGAKIGTLIQRLRLQILYVYFKRLVGQVAHHIVVGGNRVIAQKSPQATKA